MFIHPEKNNWCVQWSRKPEKCWGVKAKPQVFYRLIYLKMINIPLSVSSKKSEATQIQPCSVHNHYSYKPVYIHVSLENTQSKLLIFFTRENIWSILSSQSTDHTPSIALHDVKEIETWILRLLSTPVPVPGSTRIECELLSTNIHDPFLFALPDHTRFSLVEFPLHLPLELLGIYVLQLFLRIFLQSYSFLTI